MWILVGVWVNVGLDVAGVGRRQRVGVGLDDRQVLRPAREVGVKSPVVQAVTAVFLSCKKSMVNSL